jgi:tripartite-type tricarboxylate transporter receptor subunit TctC
MHNHRLRMAVGIGLAAALALTGCGGNLDNGSDTPASTFPDRPINFLVGQDAGGSTDLIARALSDAAAADLNRPLPVINRAGANGAVAAKELAAAKADGYTIMLFVGSLAYITPLAVAADQAIDIKNYEIVTGISQDDYVLVANPATGFKTVKDIVDAKRPIKYATTGVGTGSQLSSALLFAQAGVEATAVPFNGGAPALTAVLGGQVDVASVQLGEAAAQVEAGKVTPIVTFASKRPSYMANIPTATEAGYEVPVQQSRAVVAPKGTPKEAIDRLRAAFQKSFGVDAYKAFNEKRLLTPNEVDGTTLMQQWTGSLDTYRKLVEKYKITLSS